jgi:hypothetical protein
MPKAYSVRTPPPFSRLPMPVSSSTVTIAQGKCRAAARGRLASGLALTAAAALGMAGCTSGASSTIASTRQATPGGTSSPALTLTQAQAAYRAYLATSDRAAAIGNRSLALSVVNDVQAALVDTQFNVARATHVKPPFPRYSYGTPAFFLPEAAPAGDPQYFVVSADRAPVAATGPAATGATAAPGGVPSPDLAAGVALPAQGHVLMLFEQPAKGATWRLASTSQLAPGQSVPKLATDSHGYALTESMSAPDASQLVRPALAGPLQAAVVDDGPASAASRVVASGPLTTGMYEMARTSARGVSAPPGDAYQWMLEGSNYAHLALRTADGGALVLYAMYLNTLVQTPSVIAQADPLAPGPPIAIPDYLKALMPGAQGPARSRLLAKDVLSFAAVDPPAPKRGAQEAASPGTPAAKIQVIAIGGGVRYASAFLSRGYTSVSPPLGWWWTSLGCGLRVRRPTSW